jgi:FkbH-like protein
MTENICSRSRQYLAELLDLESSMAIPELPSRIADAGYFEALRVAQEDKERIQQYQANLQREAARASHTDMVSYPKSLNMQLQWAPCDKVGLPRIVQLINKTNQFNLTTRHTPRTKFWPYGSAHFIDAQVPLLDQFGDDSIIGIKVGISTKTATFGSTLGS